MLTKLYVVLMLTAIVGLELIVELLCAAMGV